MAGKFDSIKMFAEITKLAAEAYGILSDKALSRKSFNRDERIKDLEKQIEELKKKTT